MGAAERRRGIMRVLCRRRHETVKNLSFEFGVSERTILRDIEALSITEPIYTQCGRYDGGVYVTEGYKMDRMYMTDSELTVLNKLLRTARQGSVCNLSAVKRKYLKHLFRSIQKFKRRLFMTKKEKRII